MKLGRVLRDKWRLDRELGAGGMATVFAATHRNGSQGALKVLRPEFSGDEAIRARLLREGYLANKIRHPGIVRILDDDETEDGLVFLVMELLHGVTLKQRWMAAGRRLDVEEALDVGEAILDILMAAHALDVVHRDIKPDNVFLLESGGTKLLDFGIARVMEGAADLTHTGATLGTPAFMPPEQALAHWDRVSARSDLFSVGATLFTVLTGSLVHRATTVPELLVKSATQRAPLLATLLPDAPPALSVLIDRALEFEPEARWPDARAMLEALRAARQATADAGARLSPVPSTTAAETTHLLALPPVDALPKAAFRRSYPAHVDPVRNPTTPGVPRPERADRVTLRMLSEPGTASSTVSGKQERVSWLWPVVVLLAVASGGLGAYLAQRQESAPTPLAASATAPAPPRPPSVAAATPTSAPMVEPVGAASAVASAVPSA